MSARRINPNRIKLHRCYSVAELAICCDVHKNTVRHWQAKGLKPIEPCRPFLFHGATAREFFARTNANRKRPCPPGTFYCFKCREPRAPAGGMVEATRKNETTGNLSAICEACGTMMHRRARLAAIAVIMPNLDVQIKEVGPRICEHTKPSLNCDIRKD